MRGRHPILARGAIVAALLLSSGVGCQSQQMASVNPFLSPDRVPPPGTRPVSPGSAQPYYPGDPLPTTLSSNGNAAPQHQVAAATFVAPDGPSLAGPLANRPASGTDLAFSNEPSIAVPIDGNSLRFAKTEPAAEAVPFMPHAAAPVESATSSTGATGRGPMSPYASQAGYHQPLIEPDLVASGSESAAKGPWRSPRIEPAGVATSIGDPRAPRPSFQPAYAIAGAASPARPALTVQPTAPLPVSAPPSMDVRLRAVPSPPQSSEPSTPRIRLPGYPAPVRPMIVAEGITGQTSYQAAAPPLHQGGFVQTVEITPLASGAQGALAIAAPAQERTPAGIGSRDGFRPRRSVR